MSEDNRTLHDNNQEEAKCDDKAMPRFKKNQQKKGGYGIGGNGTERNPWTLEGDTSTQDTIPIPTSPDPIPHTRASAGLGRARQLDQPLEHVIDSRSVTTRGGRRRRNRRPSHRIGHVIQTVHRIQSRPLVEEVHQDKGRLATTVRGLTLGRRATKVTGAAGWGVHGRHVACVRVLDVQDRQVCRV